MPQYNIDAGLKQPAYMQLYHQIRDDITRGVCPYGMKLPSKRFLATETGTSVITVQHAYDLLADEGYIRSQERSGYFVSYRENELFPVAPDSSTESEFPVAPDSSTESEFSANIPDHHEISDIPIRGPILNPEQEQFPFTVLAKTARKVLTEHGEKLLQRSPNSGTMFLREAIAQYLARSRRIIVSPEQIVIGSGSEYLYNLIVQMLGRERTFALEDPSYEKIRLVYEASGVHCEMLPMDREGVKLSALHRTSASVLHVTPFNSYPSGITASASRRAGYIRWASKENRFIIEDDFDSEFSMSAKAEDTLFSLEPQRSVIYMNTFTRTISPAVRVGYMVLPAQLSAALQDTISIYSCTVPVFTQHLLAEVIRSGDFERHINRVRRRRRQAADQ